MRPRRTGASPACCRAHRGPAGAAGGPAPDAPDDGYRAHLIGGGTPPPVAGALVELGRAIRSGRYATVTTTVPDLTW
ncbi:hypothetical protein JCM9534A_79060 [Catenuloplanes indicus JCM 9534]